MLGALHLRTAGDGALCIGGADEAILTQPFNQLAPVQWPSIQPYIILI